MRRLPQILPSDSEKAIEWITSAWMSASENSLRSTGISSWEPHLDSSVNEVLILRSCFIDCPIMPTKDISNARSQFREVPPLSFFEKLPTKWITSAIPLLRKSYPTLSKSSFRLLFFRDSLFPIQSPAQISAAQYIALLGTSTFPSLSDWVFSAPCNLMRALIPYLPTWTPVIATKFYKIHAHRLYSLGITPLTPVSDPFSVYYHFATINPRLVVECIHSCNHSSLCPIWSCLSAHQRQRILSRALHQRAKQSISDMSDNFVSAVIDTRFNTTSLLHVRLQKCIKMPFSDIIDPVILTIVNTLSNKQWNNKFLSPIFLHFVHHALQSNYAAIIIEYVELFYASGITLEQTTLDLIAPLFPSYHDYLIWSSTKLRLNQ